MPEADAMTGLCTIAGNRKALIPDGLQLDWPAHTPSGNRHKGGARCDGSFRAEGTAHKGTDHVHVHRIDTELLRDPVLQSMHELTGFINRELLPIPGAARREQLDGIVVLRRR